MHFSRPSPLAQSEKNYTLMPLEVIVPSVSHACGVIYISQNVTQLWMVSVKAAIAIILSSIYKRTTHIVA